jgi:hypothetical protein
VSEINKNCLDVDRPGMVPRETYSDILNQSKLAVFLGRGGQNDRGPLEALSCGTQLLLGGCENKHRTTWQNSDVTSIINPDNPIKVAYAIHDRLRTWTSSNRLKIKRYFDRSNGLEGVVLPQMAKLFNVIRQNPVPDIEAIRKEYEL